MFQLSEYTLNAEKLHWETQQHPGHRDAQEHSHPLSQELGQNHQ